MLDFPMNYTVKKLSASDVDVFEALLSLWHEEENAAKPIPSSDYLRALLARESFHVLVALDGDVVAGGLTAYELPTYFEKGHEMFLYEIGTDDRYMRKGIATALIDALKRICSEKDIRCLYVGTAINNQPARYLYRNTGGSFDNVAWYTYTLAD
jgi:ribosomal protein S18 acetylase RimI-like enzyme